jgi:DNA polymerase elongation subunit (family B)
MKHLEETPWFICDEGDINFCAYSDTDSVYLNAQPLAEFLYPNFNQFPEEEKDNIIEKLALKYQNIITNYYDVLVKNCFNIPDKIGNINHKHVLEMKTEAVIKSAYFRATRRYAQWITKKEGIAKEELDIKGLEFMKANFPPIFGEFFNDILKQVLKGAKHKDVLEQIKTFKKQILTGEIPINKLGNPTSVKKLEKYTAKKPKAGEVFTGIESGAPAPVRAAIRYNDLLRLWKLDKKHNLITMSDKVKWIYLKDNSYKIEALAFLDYDMPDKIKEFLDIYADKQQVFDSILLNKLEGFFSDLGWSLDLNPHISMLSSYEI